MKTLHHITLNTGHLAETPRSAVSQKVMDRLLPLIDNESGEFPHLNIGFDIDRPLDQNGAPINGAAIIHIMPTPETSDISYAICIGCWRDEFSAPAWGRLREIYTGWTPALRACRLWKPMAEAPPPVPWLAVVILPTIVMLDEDRLRMLGDMERCLFWALAEGS